MTNIVKKLRMRSALSRDRGWHVGKHEDADTDDEAAEEIERLQKKLLQIDILFSDAVQSDCENGVRSLNEKAYTNYLKEYPATLLAIQNMHDIIDTVIEWENTNDV
jgi:hypothetical protein